MRRSDPLPLSIRRHIDQVCLGFEAAWQRTPRPAIEPYVQGIGEPERSALLAELLLLDLDYRLRSGEVPDRDDYLAAFTDEGRLIEDVFRRSGLASPATGRRLGYFGDYELIGEIARGGMGIVYKARQVSLDRVVALKMIRAGRLASVQDVERFRQEARTAAALQHPNIVAIHEVGEHEQQHYFSMDYVEGKSLAEVVRHRPLTAQRAAGCMRTIAAAVHYAHQQGTLHRDLKPSNVIMDPAGEPHITDFGLARPVESVCDLTASGQVLGTPSYMSPEQAEGDLAAVGPLSDVYGLGATLYELLTGRPPFRSDTAVATLRHVLEEEPVAPRCLNPAVPRDLDVICLRCLQKEPQRRYESAQALVDDLDRFLRGEPILARPIGAFAQLVRWCRRKPLVAGLSAATLLLLVVIAIGASVAALLLARQQNALLRAEQNAVDKLWHSYLAEARAWRFSGRPGRRLDSLDALASAAAIRPSLELRNEAIASMALMDVRLIREIDGHPGYTVAFDSKLERYCFSDEEGNVVVRSLADDQELLRLPGPGVPAWTPRFSAGGGYLAAKYSARNRRIPNSVWVWDLSARRAVLKTEEPVDDTALAISPDERFVAVGGLDSTVAVFDLQTSREVRRLSFDEQACDLVYHPDGTTMAVVQNIDRILFCDSTTGSIRAAAPGLGKPSWDPQGALLAIGNIDSRVYVHDALTGAERAILEGHSSTPFETTFSVDGLLLASSGEDLTVRLWHPFDSVPLLTLSGERSPRFGSNDRLVTQRVDSSKSSLFELVRSPECTRLAIEEKGVPRLWCAAIHPDGHLLAGAYDDAVRVWDLRTSRQVADLPGNWRSAVFSPDGRTLIASGGSGVWRWPIVGPAGSLHLATDPGEQIPLPDGFVPHFVSLGHDGQTLAVATPTTALLLDLATGSEIARFSGQTGMTHAAVDSGGRWLACSSWRGSGVRVFDLRTQEVVFNMPEASDAVAAFSPDGEWLLVAVPREYQLWRTGSWQAGPRIARGGTVRIPGAAAYSPDGRLLAVVASSTQVQLIDPATGDELATLETPDVHQFVAALCFSPDGSRLVTASRSRRLHVWDLPRIRQRLASMNLDWE